MKLSGVLLLSFFSFQSLTVLAQSTSIRPEVGVNLATIRDIGYMESAEFKTSPRAGIHIKIPAGSKKLYMEPGFFYSGKGYQKGTSYKFNVHTFEVPVNVIYEVPVKKSGLIFLSAGLYGGYYVMGEEILNSEGERETNSLDIGRDIMDDIQALDMGVNLSVGYQFPFGLYIRAQYGLGIPEFLLNYDQYKNRVLSLSIGFDGRITNAPSFNESLLLQD